MERYLYHIKNNFLGWIVPKKYVTTTYAVPNNTFYISTESSYPTPYIALLYLYSGDSVITSIGWSFYDWSTFIYYCSHPDNYLKLTDVPLTPIHKIWEVEATPEDLTIKCNGVEVLHFIYDNNLNSDCVTSVKGKEVTGLAFYELENATKTFTTDLLGK